MKIRVERDALADAVTVAARSLPNKPSVPVLAGVMLRVTVGKLTVSAFDYEVSTQATVPIEPGGDDGAALVSGRLLAEICKALPRKPVDLYLTGPHLEVVCGSARFTLPTMPAEDYPALPHMPDPAGTISAAEFATAIAQVAIAAGRDETLPMMTGVRIEISGNKMRLMATDRYRLAVRELDWTAEDPDIDVKVLPPARNVHDMVKALGAGGDLTIAQSGTGPGEGMIGFSAPGWRMTTRLLDGANYPPVMSLFPAAFNAHAILPVATLVEVVKRVALVAERTTPVLLSFGPDGLIVEAGGTEEARASEAMNATFTGEPLTIGFNPQYLLDGLAHLGTAHALINFVDAFKPAVITPADEGGKPIPGYRYLLMPIRVTR